MNLYNGETLEDLMSRVASVVYKIDPESILSHEDPLRGLKKVCEKEGRPLSDLAWRLLVLESCGQIAYNQLDLFFESDGPTEPGFPGWEVKEEFKDYLR